MQDKEFFQEEIEFKGILWDAFFGSCCFRDVDNGKCSKLKKKCMVVDCPDWKGLQFIVDGCKALSFFYLTERCAYGGVVKGKGTRVCMFEKVGEQVRNNSCKLEDCNVWKKLSKLRRKKVIKINE